MKFLYVFLILISCTKKEVLEKQMEDRIEFAENQEKINITYKLETPEEQTECKNLTHMETVDDTTSASMKLDGRVRLGQCISGFSYTLNTYTTDKSCFIDCQINHRYSDSVQNNCYRRCMALYGQSGNKVIIYVKAP